MNTTLLNNENNNLKDSKSIPSFKIDESIIRDEKESAKAAPLYNVSKATVYTSNTRQK